MATSLALISSQLEAAVADAPPLPAEAIELLLPQFVGDPDVALPPCEALCRALALPCERNSTLPPAKERLPARVVSGRATALERTLWRTHFDGGLHELLSHELVTALALHLRQVVAAVPAHAGDPPTILELGAGSGELTQRLARALGGIARCIAVDDASSGIGMRSHVQTLDCASALTAYSPVAVLVCWCPSAVDFSSHIRACTSVREYVLLGECDGSTCGDAWVTWGIPPERADEYGISEDTPAPYAADGFVRTELEQISRWSICRWLQLALAKRRNVCSLTVWSWWRAGRRGEGTRGARGGRGASVRWCADTARTPLVQGSTRPPRVASRRRSASGGQRWRPLRR